MPPVQVMCYQAETLFSHQLIWRRPLIFCVAIGFVFAMSGMAKAAILRVPQDYPTIQSAIGAAVDGDTINIGHGTYTELLTISGKGLTLTGQSEAGVIVQAGLQCTQSN